MESAFSQQTAPARFKGLSDTSSTIPTQIYDVEATKIASDFVVNSARCSGSGRRRQPWTYTCTCKANDAGLTRRCNWKQCGSAAKFPRTHCTGTMVCPSGL